MLTKLNFLTSEGLERIINDDFGELKPDQVGESSDYSNTESHSRVIVEDSGSD